MREETSKRWLSAKAAGELLGVDRESLPRVADRANIRTRRVPGTFTAYLREDVQRVARESGSLVETELVGA